MNTSLRARIKGRIKARVLGRIYQIWLLRYAAPLFFGEVVAVAFAAVFLARFVYVADVVSNMIEASQGNPWSAFVYLLSAFVSTSLLKKAVILVIAGGAILFFRDINRSIIAYARLRRNERFSI